MEEFEYDVVIYGTGLVNCLVASILTKNKFKVLHIDKYSEYGNNYRTLSFRQLLELKNLVPLSCSSTKVNDPSTPTGSETAVNRYISGSSLSSLDSSSSLNLTKRTSTLETCDRRDSLDSSNGPGTLSSINSISSINSSLTPQTNDETLVENLTSRSESGHLVTNRTQLQDEHQIYYKVDPFGENQEGVLNNLMKQSNSFNIDLWPRILLNNTTFTDFLVYTNIHKQLQLCTNINTNVLFTYESYLMPSDATNAVNGDVSDGRSGKATSSSSSSAEEGVEDGEEGTKVTADRETKGDDHNSTGNTDGVEEELKDDMSTSSTNDGIEPGSQTKSDKSEKKDKGSSSSSTSKNISKTTALLFELVHDKNSIFRSKYLDLKEKRLLTRFINTSLFGSTGVKESNNGRKGNNEGEDEDVEGENEDKLDKKSKRGSRRKIKKENDGATTSSGVDKDGSESDGGNEEEVNETWVEYLKKNNLNEKLINIVNCMRLSVVKEASKNKCKLELSNYLKSFKVGSDKTATENRNCIIYCLYGTNNLIQHLCRLSSLNNCHYMLNHEIKDMEVVERSVYSRVNSIVSTKSETSKKDDNETGKKDNNKDTNEGNDAVTNESKETSSDNELNGTDSKDGNNTKILLHLDGYEIYTNYVITEYPVSTTATINRVNSTKDGTTESSVASNTDKKLLVVCMISDRMVLDDINMCMVIPGSNVETDKTNTSGSEVNDGGSTGDGKVDQSNSDNWTVILQTCKDSQSSPEGMYVLYFMSIASTSSNSTGTDDSPSGPEGKGSVGNHEASEESEKQDSNVLRMVNMYKSLIGDMKHMLFMSYGYYEMDNEIEVIESNNNSNGSSDNGNGSGKRNNSATNSANDSSRTMDSNNSADGTSREEDAQSVNHLTVYSNKYKNDSLLVFMNELKISEKVAKLVLRLNNENKSEKSVDGEGAVGKVVEKEGEVDFEQYLKCIVPEEDDQVDINCDFFMDFVNKFF
ncbi:hypothetical protein MACK_002500 [Theileria orientalis]|uniref:GDP dissociation inhibitor n=1 Tax=Theileria orientalis TaxID=68886 RepID=A0A976QXD6_THEOR|nr:hypothetical protein MACK_002500 [Theileria orientalis]